MLVHMGHRLKCLQNSGFYKNLSDYNKLFYGIMLDKSLDCFMRTAPMFHAEPSIWIEADDGSLVYGTVQPEMKDALEVWARFHQASQVDHLRRAGLRDGIMPRHQRPVDRAAVFGRVVHLPYGVVAVCYAGRSVEDAPVECAAHVPRGRVSLIVGPELQRVVLIEGFDVDYGLGWRAAEVVENL